MFTSEQLEALDYVNRIMFPNDVARELMDLGVTPGFANYMTGSDTFRKGVVEWYTVFSQCPEILMWINQTCDKWAKNDTN